MGKMHRPKGLKESYTSSIPTKYQTVFISNEEKKGFSSQTKRFILTDCQDENPGPGSYMSLRQADIISPSYSKKGTGGLASQTVRVARPPQRGIPGPNAYNLQSSLIQRHSFGRGASRTFRPPVAMQLQQQHEASPGPNKYKVCFDGIQRNTTVSAKSVFLSKTTRSSFTLHSKGPSPCHYNVNDAGSQKSSNISLSCFRSTTARIPSSVTHQGPGPATYSPYRPPEPLNRTTLPRRHYLRISAAPVTPPGSPPFPGPGQYDLGVYDQPSRHCVSSAVFVSSSSRWPRDTQDPAAPGPGFYEPEKMSKQSFLYNHSRNWIPA
ncbi:O(6)-methylguanine-induced apoptosis 2 isoform X2 [Osmerus eperlanus]